MNRLQQILRSGLLDLPPLPFYKRVALKHIMTCQTAECGTIRRQCDHCDVSSFQYKSCGSRYCNQCGHLKKSLWVDERLHESLNVEYFFTTFTIPNRLHQIFLYNEKLCYGLLFKASAEALKAAMKGEYGCELGVGFMSVLHTDNQELGFHPHIHMLIPGGGISEDQMEWVSAKKHFLVSEKILKMLFRVKLAQALKKMFEKNKLTLPPSLNFIDADVFFRFVYGHEKHWNLKIEACDRHPEHVIHYLGRYVNKTAISDERIVSCNQNQITIKVKDRETNLIKKVSVDSKSFIQRFLLHILPKGMGRIRYFGFLSCRLKSQSLSLLETLLQNQGEHLSQTTLMQSLKLTLLQRMIRLGPPCECCKQGHLKFVEILTGHQGIISKHLIELRMGIP